MSLLIYVHHVGILLLKIKKFVNITNVPDRRTGVPSSMGTLQYTTMVNDTVMTRAESSRVFFWIRRTTQVMGILFLMHLPSSQR